MLRNLPNFIRSYRDNHIDFLRVVISDSFQRLGGAIFYGLLPVLLAFYMGETKIGIYLAIFNLIQTFIFNPIGGIISDKNGSKKVLLFASFVMSLCGVIWLVFPLSFLIIILSSVFIFIYFAAAIPETYILRTISKNEGGFAFGVKENLNAIGYFLSTLFIPYFIITKNTFVFGLVLFCCGMFGFLLQKNIKDDLSSKNKFVEKRNIFFAIKGSIRFIKINKGYPILNLGINLFQGLFYGTIWFVLPLAILNGDANLFGGLTLGIYEVITIFFAGYFGYLSDKFNWKKIHTLGWGFMIVGLFLMPIFPSVWFLILVGIIIAIGNNLVFFSSNHALEEFDFDHKDDGVFESVSKSFQDFGYAFSPLIAGFFYEIYGLSFSLAVNSIICVSLGFIMLYVSFRNNN